MSKKKTSTIMWWCLTLCFALFLCSCQDNVISQTSNSQHVSNILQVQETTSGASAENENAASQQTPENQLFITYINFEGDYLPISCINNGMQLLAGNVGLYSCFADKLPDCTPSAEDLPTILPSNDNTSLNQAQMLLHIVSNGEWDFFPDKAIHQTYSLENQPNDPDWVNFFENRLENLNYDGPTIISESLVFEWCGVKTAVVTASNIIVANKEGLCDIPEDIYRTTEQPYNENPLIYIISALFIQENSPLELFGQYIEIPKEQKTCAWLGTSYVPWDNNYSLYTHLISAIQYDSFGALMEYPIFCNYGGELRLRDFKYVPQYLVCDVDGDQKSELIEYIKKNSSSMSFCKVFKLDSTTPKEVLYIVPN